MSFLDVLVPYGNQSSERTVAIINPDDVRDSAALADQHQPKVVNRVCDLAARDLDLVEGIGAVSLAAQRVGWGDVWIGAAVTAMLFTVGRFLIGLYIGKTGVASGFGAAGSVAVVFVGIVTRFRQSGVFHLQTFTRQPERRSWT